MAHLKNSDKVISNFMYFGMNYPSDFISKVWHDDTRMAVHFSKKFNDLYDTFGTSTFFHWYVACLGDEAKVKLNDWIADNYEAFPRFKIDEV